MIEIRKLTRRFGNFHLNNISMDIGDGEYVVLVGDSGSGKSLLLELIAGLVKPDSGTIILNNRDLMAHPLRMSPFGIVYQDLALFPHFTVFDNISYPLVIRKVPGDELIQTVDRLADELEIKGLLKRYPENLSGGEKQRVALARALTTRPACLLLDEPLSSVDAHKRKDIKSLLRRINRNGQTIIHVTHDYQEAVNLASQIGILENGCLIRFGPAMEVLNNPANPFMASFIGIRNFFRVTIKKDRVGSSTKALTSQGISINVPNNLNEGNGYIVIPEDAVFLSITTVDTSALNQLPGTITEIVQTPDGFEVSVDVGFPLLTRVTSEGLHHLSISPGDSVYAGFKATAVRYIESE